MGLIGIAVSIIVAAFGVLIYIFATTAAIDREFGPINAIKEGWRIVAAHPWQLIGLALVLYFLLIAGSLLLELGLYAIAMTLHVELQTTLSEQGTAVMSSSGLLLLLSLLGGGRSASSRSRS